MCKSKNLFYHTIYKNINSLKNKNGLTNQDLAITLNVSESFIKNISQGNSHYNLEHIFILINEYKWDVNDIIPHENNFDLEYDTYDKFYNQVFSDYFAKRK